MPDEQLKAPPIVPPEPPDVDTSTEADEPDEPKGVHRREVVGEVYTKKEEKKALKLSLKWALATLENPQSKSSDISRAQDIIDRFDQMKHGAIAKPPDDKKNPIIVINMTDYQGNHVDVKPKKKMVDVEAVIEPKPVGYTKGKRYRDRKEYNERRKKEKSLNKYIQVARELNEANKDVRPAD